MHPYLAEFIGTGFLILLGVGVVANVILKDTKGNNSGWMVITTAWALAVFVGVSISAPYVWRTSQSCGQCWPSYGWTI